MTKWDRQRKTQRQRDAYKRAIGPDMTGHQDTARSTVTAADQARLMSNVRATLLQCPSRPLRKRIEELRQEDGGALRRDVMFNIAQLVLEAFPEGSSEDGESILANPAAEPLLRLFIDSLTRYRNAYEPLSQRSGGKIPTGEFREMLESAFFLSNQQGRRGFTPAEVERILHAFRQKIDEVLPKGWAMCEGDLTPQTINTAREKGFEAAFCAHYKRRPQTGDNDKGNVDRVRRVLMQDQFWSGLTLHSTAGIKVPL